MVAAFIETRPFGRTATDFAEAPDLAGRRSSADVSNADGGRRSVARVRPPVSRVEYRRRRTVAVGLVVAILLGLFIGLRALLGGPVGGPLASVGSPGSAQPAVAKIWIVHPGDTLWTIALASGAHGDIRPLVDKLSAEVGGQPLQPGERIVVP
jgi:hypothetical protein